MCGFVTDIGKINHKFFAKICENNFVQSVALNKTTDMLFHFDTIFNKVRPTTTKSTSNVKQPKSCGERVLLSTTTGPSSSVFRSSKCIGSSSQNSQQRNHGDASLVNTLMRYISPLTILDPKNKGNKREFSFELKKCLDMYPNILKHVSTRHKALRRKIEQYVDASEDTKDSSHTDDEYMLFWSCLLNREIYVVSNDLYKCHRPSSFNFSGAPKLIIRVKQIDGKTTYGLSEVGDFNDYKNTWKLKSWTDPRKLRTKKLDELYTICNEHHVPTSGEYNQRLRKDIIVAELEKKLIFI